MKQGRLYKSEDYRLAAWHRNLIFEFDLSQHIELTAEQTYLASSMRIEVAPYCFTRAQCSGNCRDTRVD